MARKDEEGVFNSDGRGQKKLHAKIELAWS